MAGRKPKPTALKIVQGNPGKRALPKNEPQAPKLTAPAPNWLSGDAKKNYDELAQLLGESRILTALDRVALVQLCDAMAEYRMAREELNRLNQLTYTTESGQVKPQPEVQIANAAATRIRALLVEFGMTPSARTRVKTTEAPKANPLDEFLGGKKKAPG